jgi:hypothetical protein
MKQFTVTQAELKVINSDFKRAKKYLHFLEKEKAKGKASVASVREALSLAAAVAYNRPFTACRRVGGGKRPWIPNGLTNDLSPKFQKFHQLLKKQRNEIWAHTDENAYDTSDPIKILARTFIPGFEQLINEVIARLRVP